MINNTKFSLYEKMLNLVKLYKCNYLTFNGRDVLNLPWHIPMETSIVDFMKAAFSTYNLLVKDAQGADQDNILNTKIEGTSSNLIQVMEKYLEGNISGAYESFKKVMKILSTEDNLLPIKEIANGTPFYRARRGKGHKIENDFYHVPFNQRYLTNSERFSIAGYPCLYVGYSKEVCIKEMGKDCSLIRMALKHPHSIKVYDLTLGEEDTFWHIDKIVILFPLIASCYLVPFYCKEREKECPPSPLNFKEEYIIPQLLTMYLMNEVKDEEGNRLVDGIRYYSVKDVNLNPQNEEDMNLILFTNYEPKENCYSKICDQTIPYYDMDLLNKFKWGAPFDNK